jgi:hypothetical protein
VKFYHGVQKKVRLRDELPGFWGELEVARAKRRTSSPKNGQSETYTGREEFKTARPEDA